jgi:hypothetical protein
MKRKLSASKAKQMLKDNSAQGYALTDKQKRYFRMISHGHNPRSRKIR